MYTCIYLCTPGQASCPARPTPRLCVAPRRTSITIAIAITITITVTNHYLYYYCYYYYYYYYYPPPSVVHESGVK